MPFPVPQRPRLSAQRERTQTVHLPCPDGINLATPITQLTPGDALFMVNLIRSEYGLRSRLGYREWVTTIGGGGGGLIGGEGGPQ
jgi:hypothetical protein